MPAKLLPIAEYFYIWKFKDPDEARYEVYSRDNDLISLRLFTVSIMLITGAFLIVDLGRPVDYFWVFVCRFGLVVSYALLLFWVYFRRFSANGVQLILILQIFVTYTFYFAQAFLAKMPFFFLPNVLLLFFYTSSTISGLRFRYALIINISICMVFIGLAEFITDEYYRSQYPNLISNLLVSIICAAFIEKQKRKDFLQYSKLLLQKEELDELNQQKNRVISILSHDVASPLRSVNGLLTTYEKNQITKEELDRFLPDVKVRLDKVSFLVYSLVRWSKSQMKGFMVQKVLVEIGPLVSENVALILPFAKEKTISIEVDCPLELKVFVDHEMIHLIIRNLLSNAVKFTRNGGSIQVRAYRQENKIIVQVSNEGDEIPESVREKLFTFQIRSGQGTANESGTGLGLAMSQQFAGLNGGQIYLASRSGTMNTFCIEFPVVQ